MEFSAKTWVAILMICRFWRMRKYITHDLRPQISADVKTNMEITEQGSFWQSLRLML